MERTPSPSRPKTPGPHPAHPLPSQSRCLSGRTGTKGLPANFADLGFFSDSPDELFLRGVIAGWQVGTVKVDGVACRHLFFSQQAGVDVELWVEQNSAAIPHRLIVTYRLLP